MADDIVTTLHDNCTCDPDYSMHCSACQAADEIEDLRFEIKRLRAAGDQLAYHVRAENSKEMYTAVRIWEEARRG